MHNLENNMLLYMDMEKEFQNTHSENQNIGRNKHFQLHVTVIISVIV